ncbi:MAG: imidazole glycerol phosphate synthase subunit HisH [Pseudanabaenaceae cyanobacterium]
MPTIAVIDYDCGNLHSVCKGIEAVGGRAIITHERRQILTADGIVLPGVGAFDPAVHKLRQAGLDMVIKEAIAQGQPLLGICLGLQVLFESSAEGQTAGLGIVAGRVERLRTEPDVAIPHMGWNQLAFTQVNCPLWQGLASGAWVYFVHSYYGQPRDPAVVSAVTTYGSQTVPVAIAKNKVMAVQFHPEKSGQNGLQILANFIQLLGR